MITVILIGLAVVVMIAVAIGIIDAVQAPTWRAVAAERRMAWETRRRAFASAPAERTTSTGARP